MGYKVLGYVVWHGGKWYLRRRMPDDAGRKAALGGAAAAALVAGVLIAQRQPDSS